jgi:hypothetical protein
MSFVFQTTVDDLPCFCKVIHYRPFIPANKTGWAENWEEEIPSEFEYQIYDPDGTIWDGVRLAFISDADEDRLQDEYEAAVMADKHGKEF